MSTIKRNWTRVRIKHVARIRYGLGQPPPLGDSGIPILRATNIQRGRIRADGMAHADRRDLPLDRVPLLGEGEILVVRTGAYTGDSALVTHEWAGSSPGYDLRLTPTTIDPKYLAYSMLSTFTLAQVEVAKSRAAQPHLNAEELGEISIDLPPAKVQDRIVEMLDEEISKIDAIVSKKSRLLALLQERIDSRILSHIGESQLVKADARFRAVPIRRALSKVRRPPVENEEVVTAFRDGQVTARSIRRREGYTMPLATAAQGQYTEVGDVVIHGLDGFAGAIGTAEVSGNCSPIYHVCVPRDRGSSLYLGRLLRVLAKSGYLALFATSTRERAVDFRNWDFFGNIPIPSIPAEEQTAVAEWIDALRPIRIALEQSNALATERRAALITAAVSGQIDVSTPSGRAIED